nr:hypothetical protein [Meridianimarinicoccus roseus]
MSANSYLSRNLAKLDAAADATVRFAAALVRTRGHGAGADVSAVKLAGYSDAEIVEIVAHVARVALNTPTNYLNEAVGTPIDFPVASARVA